MGKLKTGEQLVNHQLNAAENQFQQLLQTLIDHTPSAVYSRNCTGQYLFANKYYLDLFELTWDEVKGKTDFDLFPKEIAEVFRKNDLDVIKAGKPVQSEELAPQKDGLHTYFSVKFPLLDHSGQVYAICGISTDITEAKRAQALIADQEAKMVIASKLSSLGEMAGGVAHEINNPLAVIKTLSSQLQEIVVENPLDTLLVKEITSKIEKTTDRIARIVQGLRSFSRDGSNDPFSAVNVHQLIEETLSFCNERFKYLGVRVSIEDFKKDLSLEGRATELSQVLLNLLNNANDAIMDLKEKWIKISVSNKKDWVEIQVTDSGKGIPLDIQRKIFQPFFTTKEIGKGTGLGLSISSGIIQSYRGELKIDHKSPNTCFIIRLPKTQKSEHFKAVS